MSDVLGKKSYTTKRLTIGKFLHGVNNFENEFELNHAQAKLCYNMKNFEGALTQGNGFEELCLPNTKLIPDETRKLSYDNTTTYSKIWRYKYYSDFNKDYEYVLLAFGSDNKIHYIDLFGYNTILSSLDEFVFSSTPVALNFRVDGKDVVGFCSGSDPLTVWYCDKQPYQVTTAPKFSSICLHNERLFAIDSENNNLVRYSSNLNPLDWTSSVTTTSGGSIELNDYKGMLKTLISFLDNVFVFRDFGISKISSYSANSLFSAVNIYNTSCKIFCNTACICGDNIYFLSEDGLYKLDGFKVEKVDGSFSNLFKGKSQENANTCFFDGKLYIACALNFGDEEETEKTKNNCLIEYDIENKTYNITRGVDITSMLAIKDLSISKLVLCMNSSFGTIFWQLTNDGKFNGTVLPRNWTGGKINFGLFDKNKVLKEVNLICKHDCVLKITTDTATRSYQISGKEDVQRVRINCSGKYFSFAFESTADDMYVSNPQFVFNVEK